MQGTSDITLKKIEVLLLFYWFVRKLYDLKKNGLYFYAGLKGLPGASSV